MPPETSRITISPSSVATSASSIGRTRSSRAPLPRATCLANTSPYDEVPWFWSDQYDANLQYAGFHTKWDQLILRGRVDSGSFLACYINDGRIDAVVGFNRGKDVRRAMSLIKERRAVSLEELADESVDLRSVSISSGPRGPL